MELRPYQKKVVYDVRNALRYNRGVCAVLPCGGGKSVIIGNIAKMTTDKGNRVLFLVHRQELCEQIYQTFIKCGVNMDLVNIEMVQTACKHLDDLQTPNLIITDEAHHSKSISYTKIYDYFSTTKLLGFTATPTRLDKQDLSEIYSCRVESVSVQWLIDNHYLAPFRYYSAKLLDEKDFDNKFKIAEILAEKSVYGDVISNYQRIAENKSAICYCPSIATSKTMAENFRNNGISAVHIDGNTSKIVRNSAIEDFRNGKIKIICNVDLISEGFDVPDCEVVILLRPTQSLTLHIQQSMRSMRYKVNKTAIIIDHVNNYLKYGLPTQMRDWDGINEEERKKMISNKEAPEQKCPNCFYVGLREDFQIDKYKMMCPLCGYEWERPIKNRENGNFIDCNLSEVRGFTVKGMDESYKNCNDISSLVKYGFDKHYKKTWCVHKSLELGFLNTFEDWKILAKNLQYKPYWAYINAKNRGLVK